MKKISLIPRKFVWLAAVAIVLSGILAYHAKNSATADVSYQTAAVQKGSLVASVTGTGQVSASNQIDVKPSVSGTVLWVNAQAGEPMKAGMLLATIDASDAQKSVRDAQLNVDKANLALQQLQEPADQTTLLEDQDTVAQAEQTLQTDQQNLAKAYQDGFNDITAAFVDLPTVINGLDTILHAQTLNTYANQPNVSYYSDAAKGYDARAVGYKDAAENAYALARNEYNQNFQDYNSTTRLSDKATIESVINETYQTGKDTASAVQAAQVVIQFYKDELQAHGLTPVSLASTNLASLNTYTTDLNSDITTLASITQTLQGDKDAITNAQGALQEKQDALAKLQAGADPLQVKSDQFALQQAQNALSDAQANLADYSIRAPFDGIAATMGVKKGDSVSSATVVSSFVTADDIAQISLNEVDVTKVKVGQDATLTFDAIPDFSIAGKVVEIDTLGTVSQGVVDYAVKIGFSTQDSRVKPGMSVSASIITDVHQDTLIVPNAAVKTAGTQKYVQVLASGEPQDQPVTVGLSNDTMTEILSGVQEGDNVITQTINPNAAANSPSRTGLPGAGGGPTLRGGSGGRMLQIGG